VGLLNDIFGPSKEMIWQQFAEQIGGKYIDGGFWRQDKIEAMYKDWFITLDTYTESHTDSDGDTSHTTYTRIRGAFLNTNGLRFKLYNASLFSGIGKFFGFQDIDIGHSFFDDRYVIKGNDPEAITKLFTSPRIQQLIGVQPKIHLELKDDKGWFNDHFPQGVDELYFETVGVIKDLSQLRHLYDLFAEVLNTLCHLDAGYEYDSLLSESDL
jgi:hypothetical protein